MKNYKVEYHNDHLRMAREAKNLTQIMLATILNEKLGKSVDAEGTRVRISKLERGITSISQITVEEASALRSILDVDMGYLLGTQDEPCKSTADVAEVTGLSYEAVEKLVQIKGTFYANSSLYSDTVSAFIEDEHFNDFVVDALAYCMERNTAGSQETFVSKIKHFEVSKKQVIQTDMVMILSKMLDSIQQKHLTDFENKDSCAKFAQIYANGMAEGNRQLDDEDRGILDAIKKCGINMDELIDKVKEEKIDGNKTRKR